MNTVRKLNATLCIPFIAITGYEFSRDHRLYNTLVYRLVDTVHANIRGLILARKFGSKRL
jgi:hypothetical protein